MAFNEAVELKYTNSNGDCLRRELFYSCLELGNTNLLSLVKENHMVIIYRKLQITGECNSEVNRKGVLR